MRRCQTPRGRRPTVPPLGRRTQGQAISACPPRRSDRTQPHDRRRVPRLLPSGVARGVAYRRCLVRCSLDLSRWPDMPTLVTTRTTTPDFRAERPLDEAELAAAAFLARYS